MAYVHAFKEGESVSVNGELIFSIVRIKGKSVVVAIHADRDKYRIQIGALEPADPPEEI